MAKSHKTNAMRLLDAAEIAYRAVSYDVDESDLSGMHVAQQLGQSPDQVFKTLVTEGEGTYMAVFCIPVSCELNLKKAARAAKVKRLEMLPLKELFARTGYIRGGCSPLGMKKQLPTYIDETAQLFDEVAVSAGVRGQQIIVNPDDLCRAASAEFADLV